MGVIGQGPSLKAPFACYHRSLMNPSNHLKIKDLESLKPKEI